MSIRTYEDNNSSLLFMVRVDLRSRYNRNIRVVRKAHGIKSEAAAIREEKKMYRLCTDLLHKKENQGASLGALIRKWAKHSDLSRVKTGEVGSKLIYDHKLTLQKWLKPYLSKPAYDFTDYMYSEVIRKMQVENISRSQLIKFKRMVKVIYEFGLTYNHLPQGTKVPQAELKMPSKAEFVPEILSHEEIMKLVEEAIVQKHPWRFVWIVALLTGMRSGELRALMWSDVAWTNKLIRVSKSVEQVSKQIKSTKAGYWRDIPISPELERLLKEVRLETKDTGFVLPRIPKWDSGCQAEVLRSFCKQVGLPSIRFHTLRACFATQLLQNGVEAAKVMKICGWRDLSTMQRYVRLAGIEVMGVTDSLSVLPPTDFGSKIVHIRRI